MKTKTYYSHSDQKSNWADLYLFWWRFQFLQLEIISFVDSSNIMIDFFWSRQNPMFRWKYISSIMITV